MLLLLIVVGSTSGAWAFNASITDQASWNEAMEKLKTTENTWNVLNIDADVTLSGVIKFDDNTLSGYVRVVVLDLNGHKLNAEGIVIDRSGRVLPSSELQETRFILKDSEYKAVTFDSGTTTVTNTNDGCLTLEKGVQVRGGAKLLFESGVIDGENCTYPVVMAYGDQTGTSSVNSEAYVNNGYIKGLEGCASVYGKGATVYVDGTQGMEYDGYTYGCNDGCPVLTCKDNAPVSGNGTHNAKVNYGGTNITVGKSVIVGNIKTASYVACGIYHPQSGVLTIKDGAQIYANGGVGVLMRGGTLNMTGGEIIASGDKDLTGKVGDARVVVPTSGIVFDDCAGYYDHSNVSVAVSGGTVTGSHSAVDVVKGEASANPEKQIQLSGGTYSSDIAVFAAEGKGAQKSKNTYTIGEEVATVEYADGTVGHYATLQSALDAATDGSTVKLMDNVDKASFSAGRDNDADKSIVLDLNGKSLVVSAAVSGGRFHVYCSLTVTDSQGNGSIGSYGTGNSTPLFYISTTSANAHLTLDGGKYIAKALVFYDANYYTGNPLIELKNGYFYCDGLFVGNAPESPNVKIYKGYFKVDWNINKYLAPGCEKLTYGHNDYAVRTRMRPLKLTYGDTTLEQEVDDKSVVIDLKDDAATAAERLSKIEVQAEKANADVTLKKNFAKANTWNALYVPFDITATAELLEKFDIAKFWDTELYWNNGTPETTIELIKLNEGDQIAAFTPCLIRAKEAGLQDVTFRDVTLYNTNAPNSIDCSTVDQKFTFTGVLANTPLSGNYAINGNGQLVHSTNSAAQVTPFKFYMAIENKDGSTVQKAPAYRMHVIGEETTGISDVNAAAKHQPNGKVYNLQGVAVGNNMAGLPAGVYVQNGRKVIVK